MDKNISDYTGADYDSLKIGTVSQQGWFLDCLLRRGFLVRMHEGKVCLLEGSHTDDAKLLESSGMETVSISKGAYTHSVNPCSNEVLQELLTSPCRNHMTGASDYMGGEKSVRPPASSFKNFKETKFGSMVPVEALEAGIALLVKVIPVIGCTTVMSCSGHGEKDSYIAAFDKWHLRWLEQCLKDEDFGVNPELLKYSEFEYSNSWDGARWWICWPDSLAKMDRWNLLLEAGKALLDLKVRELVVAKRELITSE